MSFTKGPWTVSESDFIPPDDPMLVIENEDVHIAFVFTDRPIDALLIAAAPTLLEACESALRAIEYNLPDEFLPETRAVLCAAIARATEDTPCEE